MGNPTNHPVQGPDMLRWMREVDRELERLARRTATSSAATISGLALNTDPSFAAAMIGQPSAAFVSAQTGWAVVSQEGMKYGQFRQWHVIVSRTGAAITPSTTGNFTNDPALMLVEEWKPTVLMGGSSGSTGRVSAWVINPSGSVDLAAVAGPGVVISTGDQLSVSAFYLTAPEQ